MDVLIKLLSLDLVGLIFWMFSFDLVQVVFMGFVFIKLFPLVFAPTAHNHEDDSGYHVEDDTTNADPFTNEMDTWAKRAAHWNVVDGQPSIVPTPDEVGKLFK